MSGVPEAPVITLDGPSGSGKGEISRRVADALGWHLLDSGAIYRVAAVAAASAGIDTASEDRLAALAESLDVRFEGRRILLQGRDVTDRVRREQTGTAASRLAALPGVRRSLLCLQHGFRRPPGLVADGRDMGTVVFPDAGCKVFLTATPEVRAERRHKQLKEQGISVSLARLFSDIAERDARDASRTVSPLKAADDAVVLDTTGLSIEEVVEKVLGLAAERLNTGTATGGT